MIKTVYGPPPTDVERIEAAEPEDENCIREDAGGDDPVKNGKNPQQGYPV